MLSARMFARSAPRALNRLAATPLLRQQSAATLLKPSATAALARSSMRPAAFSTTVARRAGESDEELSAKLASEVQIEEEMKVTEQEPASIKDFLASTPFELIDTPGLETVKLVRDYNDEKITISFSIADIDYGNYENDPALEDEEFDEETLQNPNKQSHVQSTGGARSAPAEEQIEEEEEDLDEPAVPVGMTITVEKPGKTDGALQIGVTSRSGAIVLDSMLYFEDAKLAKAEDAESNNGRADVFAGPPFETLDEDLQVMMERYLEERGVTQALAVFAPDYLDLKEQREYLRWLNNVKTFVDA